MRNQKSAIRGAVSGVWSLKNNRKQGLYQKLEEFLSLKSIEVQKKKVITQFGTDFWVTTLRILSLLKTEKRGQVCFRSMPDSIPVQKSVSEEQNMWNFLYSAFWLAGQCRFWSRLRYWCKFCRGPNGAYKIIWVIFQDTSKPVAHSSRSHTGHRDSPASKQVFWVRIPFYR